MMERLCEENETERQGVEMIGGDSSVWTIKGTKMKKIKTQLWRHPPSRHSRK